MSYATNIVINMCDDSCVNISSIIHTENYRVLSKQDNLLLLDTDTKKGIIIDVVGGLIVVPGNNLYEEVVGTLPDGEYYLGREGFDIHVYQYGDKIYVSTSNCINVDDTIIRTKITNVGLNIESLFPSKNEHNGVGNTSYHYLISHRDDLIASKVDMYHKEGFAYYISQHSIRHDADSNPTNSNIEQYEELSVPLTVANEFLIKGYHPDVVPNDNELLQLGEFINVVCNDGKYVRVLSASYAWRKRLRENELKIRYGFYKHLTLAMKAKKESNSKNNILSRADYEEYSRLFPIIPYIEPRSIETYIKTHGYLLVWPKIGKLTHINYVFNTWACYILSLPLHLHQEAYNLYNDYFNVCTTCYNYIVEMWKSGAEIMPNIHCTDSIDAIAIRRIDDIIKQSTKNLGEGKIGTFEKNCQNLIRKERGSSLFAINEYITKRMN